MLLDGTPLRLGARAGTLLLLPYLPLVYALTLLNGTARFSATPPVLHRFPAILLPFTGGVAPLFPSLLNLLTAIATPFTRRTAVLFATPLDGFLPLALPPNALRLGHGPAPLRDFGTRLAAAVP